MGVRTRFAPSPTGFLHIGGARTALFSWAYARRQGGKFILRIEDTDLERSTQLSVQAILDGMRWLGLDWDEGPFFQMQRLARYQEVARQLIAAGHAYPCWATKEELEELRTRQRQNNEKPRYDGRWRPERAQAARLKPPADRPPVTRFRTPEEGEVGWHDLVKGPISFPNRELDDLVLLRADGVPTYNFGVVVDDLDMAITHVIRGDDHVNNTPRQIHIFNAMKVSLPAFAHLPMILGADGERLSKRHGAVNVMQYRDDGYLPEALVNYLARLGWSHGNDEVFSVQQMVEWFDLGHVSPSPARFDPEKALWLNQQYIRNADVGLLSKLTEESLARMNVDVRGGGPALEQVVSLLKDRAHSVTQLAEAARLFYEYTEPAADAVAKALRAPGIRAALELLEEKLKQSPWDRKSIAASVSEAVKASGLKMPELAMPARLLVTGRTQTPSLDAVLELIGREAVLARLARHLRAG